MDVESPNLSPGTRLLEVIVCSVEDALEAERGGAGRLEIVRNLELGGLTPSFETVQEICQSVAIPVRVMLRCSESHTPAPHEVEILSKQAENLAALGVDGVVLGFLLEHRVDVDLAHQVLSRAPNLKATFHRAFDETSHPLAAIQQLKKLRQVDRILTSGDRGPWETRAKLLERYQKAAAPEITILVGGGIDRVGIERLLSQTSQLREFHSGRGVRIPAEASGTVRAERVKELGSSLSGLPRQRHARHPQDSPLI
jgi:copper homeostasis protein